MDRRFPIVIAVIGFHVLGLWALQTGLLRRAVELVVPVSVLSEMIEPPQPPVTPAPPQPRPQPAPLAKATTTPQPVARPAPQPVAIAPPEPQAPTGVVEPQPLTPVSPLSAATDAPAAPTTPTAPAPAAPTAVPRIEPPTAYADYLKNPEPPYPRLSKTLEEEGTVMVRALIEPNGTASKALIHQSSGFKRLDDAAVQAVLGWRYVPGKRAGVAEAMWFDLPVKFKINKNPP